MRALLLAMVLIPFAPTSPVAGPGHAHNATEPDGKAVGMPRVSARSETYQFVGVVDGELMAISLSRVADNSAVEKAELKVTIDGEEHIARPRETGGYQLKAHDLQKPGKREVIVMIQDGATSDLLVGVLERPGQPDAHAGHAHGKDEPSHDSGSASNAPHAHPHGHSDAGDKHAHKPAGTHGVGGKTGEHATHGGHGAHGSHGEEGVVRLTPSLMKEFEVVTAQVGPGEIADEIIRPGEVSFNLDRFSHVVPRAAGIAQKIHASQGDNVETDQLLAVLESRELAELKAGYLASRERYGLANDEFTRVKALKSKGVTTDKAYLTAESALAEARIAMRSSKQKLNAMGISEETLAEITKSPDADLTRYEMRAPMSGTVIKRHLVQGELVTSEREAFVIADTSSVWVNISLYAQDLAKVAAGQRVTLVSEGGHEFNATISFVTPDVSETTRTATARAVIGEKQSNFRPGMFIKARIAIGQKAAALRVPRTAIQTHEGKEVVFVGSNGAFKPRPIVLGRRNAGFVEVITGLEPGEVIATKGSFLIKSQLSKASFGDGHNH